MWWYLVGSAVEHAAALATEAVECLAVDWHPACPVTRISFKKMFLAGEADEEQTSALATVLDALRSRWFNGFKASDVASYASRAEPSRARLNSRQPSNRPVENCSRSSPRRRSTGGSRLLSTRRYLLATKCWRCAM